MHSFVTKLCGVVMTGCSLLHHRQPISSALFGFHDNLGVILNPRLSSMLRKEAMVKG